jgi:hypothetical protein
MHLRSYIESLHQHVEQVKQERKLSKQQEAVPPPPVKCLEQQLMGYFRTLSQEQLKRPWTMIEIIEVADLKGISRDRPHPQKIAEILRRHGWQSRRVYGAHGGRQWFSPT